MQVVDALALLAPALQRAGIRLWEPPPSTAGVERLQAVLAPMGLPDELLTFWRLVDVTTLRVEPYPAFIRPADALEFWEMDRDEFASDHPLACVGVGYQSHDCMGMELDVDGISGGALFEWFVSDLDAFTRRFNTLGDWLAYIAMLVDRGICQRVDGERGPRLLAPGPDQEPEADALRPTPAAHPVHGEQFIIKPGMSEWPEHWQQVNSSLRCDDR